MLVQKLKHILQQKNNYFLFTLIDKNGYLLIIVHFNGFIYKVLELYFISAE